MASNYGKDILKQLHEVMKKCDDLTYELKKQKEEYTAKIDVLENKIVKLEDENQKLRDDNDRLKKQLNNNSNNSSKPPSTDIKPNIPNNRQKSSLPIGGQKGHKAQYLSSKKIKEKIDSKEYRHEVINIGEPTGKPVIRYILDINIEVIAKEYRIYPNEQGKYVIPKGLEAIAQYGNGLKTMCSVLSTEGIVAVDRLKDFIDNITNGKLQLSHGAVINFIKSLAKKSEPILEQVETNILNSGLMHTDATTSRCDGKNVCVRNYSTKTDTLLKATLGKGRKFIEATDILPKYTGNLVHDHETLMYRYGNKHGECNVHISRYLIGVYENTKHLWATNMRHFLCSLNEHRKILLKLNILKTPPEKLKEYYKRYDEIIQQGLKENKELKSKYYKAEEKRLLTRMIKYKTNHLMFLSDFGMPFDNNLSERELRHVKTKQKISGCFVSMKGLQNYLDIKSIIITCKKRGINFYEMIFNIYEGKLSF